jgi:hypothetical protein
MTLAEHLGLLGFGRVDLDSRQETGRSDLSPCDLPSFLVTNQTRSSMVAFLLGQRLLMHCGCVPVT